MTRRGLWLWIILLTATAAGAQGRGLWLRTGCAQITSPEAGLTWCFETGSLALKVWDGSQYVTVAAPAASGPIGASYVTVATEAGLTAERVFTAGTGLGLTDGGANSTLTVALTVPVAVASGGTGVTAAADDRVLVGSGTAWVSTALPSCAGGTDALTYTLATNSFGCNTITVPPGLTASGPPVANQLAKWTSATDLTGVAFADDTVLVASGTDWVAAALPSCSGGTNALSYNVTTNTFGCNTITGTVLPSKVWLAAAGCNGSTAGSAYDIPTADGPLAACFGTSPQRFGALNFPDGAAVIAAQTHAELPSDWDATQAVDVRLVWFSSVTTGAVIWQVRTACVADGADLIAPSFNAPKSVTDTTKGVADQRNDATITALTMGTCAGGQLLFLRVDRNAPGAGDTLEGTASLVGIELTIRRTT